MRIIVPLLALLATMPPPAGAQAAAEDAYMDPVARHLVARARDDRDRTNEALVSYTAIVRERMAAALRLPLKDRTIYRKEAASRVHWRRDGRSAVRVLALREQHPGGVEVPRNPSGFTIDELFDPTIDRLYLDLGFAEELWLEHPLAHGSEEHYRFQSGDTLEIRLPDGRVIRAVELKVIPREVSTHHVYASLYLDDATGALVQAAYRLSRTVDVEKDMDEIDPEDAEYIPGILKPMELELGLVVIEYSLWEGEHWMPRLLRMEATARAGVLSAPASLEVSYQMLHVETEDDDATAVAAADITLPEAEELRGTADYRAIRRRQNGQDIIVLVPRDSAELLTSPHLPPPIWEGAASFATEGELRGFVERLAELPKAPGAALEWDFHWGLGRPGLLRYNRVEGPSVGARIQGETPFADVGATGRLGIADLHPNVRLEAVRPSLERTLGLALYHELVAVDPDAGSFGLGASTAALLLGRDDGDYFRATGATVSLGPPPQARPWWSLALYAERHHAAERETHASVPRLFGADGFRPNVPADEVDLAGATLALRPWWGTDPTGAQLGLDLMADAATGEAEYVRGRIVGRAAVPLLAGIRVAAELGGGAASDALPTQRHWFLGGTSTLRGYRGAAAVGSHFARGRLEVGRPWPWGGVTLFSDAGWAGERDAFDADDALLSAGIGFSILDGTLRIDLARALRAPTGWSLEVHLDALM